MTRYYYLTFLKGGPSLERLEPIEGPQVTFKELPGTKIKKTNPEGLVLGLVLDGFVSLDDLQRVGGQEIRKFSKKNSRYVLFFHNPDSFIVYLGAVREPFYLSVSREGEVLLDPRRVIKK